VGLVIRPGSSGAISCGHPGARAFGPQATPGDKRLQNANCRTLSLPILLIERPSRSRERFRHALTTPPYEFLAARRDKILSRREHPSAKKFLAAAAADLLRPVHPASLAQAEKMPGVVVRRQPQVVHPEHHHARRPIWPFERRLPSQREIRHPLIQPRPALATRQASTIVRSLRSGKRDRPLPGFSTNFHNCRHHHNY
jgi:hypothetical protein